MAACPSCGRENPAEYRFCGACGAEVTRLLPCAACGFRNAAGQRFCGGCGSGLVASDTAPAQDDARERKLATVLFADVVGFTALAEDTDPEALAATVDGALRRMADVVVAHGGTIDKYLGDALMALFGVPVAHEDDAARAVAAALRLRDGDGDLSFSIGVNSGEVMVTPVGDGNVTVIGDAVNVAARLQAAAGAGEILAGPLTAELVGAGFALREREPMILKGKSRPVAVYEVMSVRAADSEMPAATRTTLVGRDAELAFLRNRFAGTMAGPRAQLVVVTGDAGAGKTRLLDEFVATLDGDAHVTRAACPGYGVLVSSRLAKELTHQLGLDGTDDTEPVVLDERGIWRVRRRLAELTADRALVLVVDDAHNASAADLDPFVQLVSRVADLPVLLVVAGRSQPAGWLAHLAGATTVRLDPLTTADSERLAALLNPEGSLPPARARALALRARGNPLHLRELMRLLGDGGDGTHDGETPGGVPATLRAVLAARLDALDPEAKAALQAVAVFSDGATHGDVVALGDAPIADALGGLVAAGLLLQDEERYVVADPLLREVAYEQLPHAARADRHRRAAAVAATEVGRARHLALAARYQPNDALLREEAAAHLARAGVALLDAGRFRDGSALVERALDLGHAQPRTLLRLAVAHNDAGPGGGRALELLDRIDAGDDPVLAAEVLHARGNATHATDPRHAVTLLESAAEAWTALGNEGKHAWAICNRGQTYFDLGLMADAARDHEAALEVFLRLGDRTAAAAAAQQLALARPDDPRVPQWLTEGLQLAEQTGDLALERNALITLAWFRFTCTHLGGPDETAAARADAERLARVCTEMGDLTFELHARCLLAVLDRLAGSIDAAEAHLARAGALLHELVAIGGTQHVDTLFAAAEFVLRLAAQPDAAGLPAPADSPSPIAVIADVLVIEGLVLAGRFTEARSHLAASALESFGIVSPFFSRMLGVVRAAVTVCGGGGAVDEVRADLLDAREAARRLGAWANEVAATALLAEALVRSGDVAAAKRELAQADRDPGGVAGILLLRARALTGDEAAAALLAERRVRLRAPGLPLEALTPAGSTATCS